MIYTSYFAKSATRPNAISIALSSPKFFKGKHYDRLAPTWDLLKWHKNGEIDEHRYKEIYMNLLKTRNVTPGQIAQDLNGMVLLCWEKPDKFCHRHIVRDWLKENGVECQEL